MPEQPQPPRLSPLMKRPIPSHASNDDESTTTPRLAHGRDSRLAPARADAPLQKTRRMPLLPLACALFWPELQRRLMSCSAKNTGSASERVWQPSSQIQKVCSCGARRNMSVDQSFNPSPTDCLLVAFWTLEAPSAQMKSARAISRCKSF